jgi:ribosome recycling factor
VHNGNGSIPPQSSHQPLTATSRRELLGLRWAPQIPQQPLRTLTTSPNLLKKSGKANRSHAKTDSSPPVSTPAPATAADEAFDFSDLEAKNLKAFEFLSRQLSELRAGGRLNPEHIERLKVLLKSDKGNETLKVSDLAQVVTKGRFILIIASEESYLKPISSAIMSSNLNVTPQGPAPGAPTTLTIPLPPPTGESRQQALQQAQKWADEALGKIREARGAHQKKLRTFQKDRKVRPDDLQKAQKRMEEVTKAANEEVKRILDGAKKVLQG